MPTRRQMLFAAATTVGLAPTAVVWLSGPAQVNPSLTASDGSPFQVARAMRHGIRR